MDTREERNNRFVWCMIVLVVLCIFATCTVQSAFAQDYPIVGECPDPVEQLSVLNGPKASGAGVGTVAPAPSPLRQRFELEYQFDSREGDSNRILSFEGVSKTTELVDLYGSLDLYNGVADDLARFTLRAGAFGEITTKAGLAFWYEDFSGSNNGRGLLGLYCDPLSQVRLVWLPVATQDGGVMARAMFETPSYKRWSLAGFVEGSWGGEDGSYDAAEPELRYALQESLWLTLEYRRDERWGDDYESLALGLRAGL